jgi:hypothetical protein
MAFAVVHILAPPQVDGLIQHAALPERIQVTDFDDLTRLWDFAIGRYSDVSTALPTIINALSFT